MTGFIYLAIAIVGEVIATSFLRASAGFSQPRQPKSACARVTKRVPRSSKFLNWL